MPNAGARRHKAGESHESRYMSLKEAVRIAPRFQRAIRIESDIERPEALQSFLCTSTFARAVTTICDQFAATAHGAYTLTGPFGGGKSSLVVAFAGALGPRGRTRDMAHAALGREVAHSVTQTFQPGVAGWRIIPVLGARAAPSSLVFDALVRARACRDTRGPRRVPSDTEVLDALQRVSKQPNHKGTVLIIDELGKTLEHLAATGGDLQFFQNLAELSSRSDRRLLVLGVLHQSFDEYVGRAGRGVRDEWAKVQGRYIDIPLSVSSSEQIELLSRAIIARRAPDAHRELAETVGDLLRRYRPDASRDVESYLRKCWPLHPVSACLLAATSRRRFGQNQRSLFGFLNSHEPAGFQDFLSNAGPDDLFMPDRLFDYLKANLEPAILASADGHRWSLALESLERVEKRAPAQDHVVLIKCIAMLDLFRERSGLLASEEVLRTLMPKSARKKLASVLQDFVSWSVVTYRTHLSAYSVFAGSDFDVQAALDDALTKISTVNLTEVRSLSNLRPIVAKRHYHQTGALRWFDVDVVALSHLEHSIAAFKTNGAMGQFLLVVPTEGEAANAVTGVLKATAATALAPIVLGSCSSAPRILELAHELMAIDHIRKHRGELAGDPVARREVDARAAAVLASLESEVRSAFGSTTWHWRESHFDSFGMGDLARLGSDLADNIYPDSPRIHNELLNRSSPSSNAVAAQKALLKCIVAQPQVARLGIVGYPAEGGLYDSLLDATRLHQTLDGVSQFHEPSRRNAAQLYPLWKETDRLLERALHEPVSAAVIYRRWDEPPFGVREGLRPVLFLAYLMTRLDRYTIYLQNSLEAELTDLTVDRLAQDPENLTLRIFDPNERERRLLDGVAHTVALLGLDKAAVEAGDAVGLARALVTIVKTQPSFAQRTSRLSRAGSTVRAAIRSAEDPHVLLHETLPAALQSLAERDNAPVATLIELLTAALTEIATVYGDTLRRFGQTLFRELGVEGSEEMLARLHERAERVHGLTGDFRLEALIVRLMSYSGSIGDIEGIASLCANKPPRDWSDNDTDRAELEAAELAQRFNRAEAFARVKGRPDGRHSIAFVVGLDHTPELVAREFEITEKDRREVLKLARDIQALTGSGTIRQEIVLAAIAQVGSDLMSEERPGRRRVAANE
jgi:hypothetical protein